MAGIRQLGLGKTLPAIAPASLSPTERECNSPALPRKSRQPPVLKNSAQ
jgi:hypothetical protein